MENTKRALDQGTAGELEGRGLSSQASGADEDPPQPSEALFIDDHDLASELFTICTHRAARACTQLLELGLRAESVAAIPPHALPSSCF